ncbi:hypothetical protein HanRHA438_Chr11g0519251 [Helianthus annuus]|uniref:Uncharacterized protein n=1 Tax=Helianthus annuus TaxID=4232 RepID=A0A251TD50_HELAN|nr:cylicin-1 [Helianthus annuus]KAF5783338.1 hypothetical protein HanXRQr2_Chr11g0506781 [Helianthus annuus]KAJ0735596.1 hypothetical protein HanPI659440_Chr11g0433901 [Helianthus annuus]KAJ0872038.1 hypothetical protein HanRHA438_Chr11g0519251 [Helianthus annuus]
MSRCFPFPPPGYEKKLITDDPDLLKKEKRREKKHKKDKKDKEKKDGKEKKEKNISGGKHKEKKDKHRDKKKDKEKSETSTHDDTNTYAQSKGYNGQILHPNNSANDKKPSTPFPLQNGDSFKNKIKVGDTKNYNVNKFETQKTDGRQVAMDAVGFSGNVAVPSRINGSTPPPLDYRRIEKMQEKGSDDKRVDKRKIEDRDKQKQEKKLEKLKENSEQKKAERAKNKHIMNSDLVAGANNSSTYSLDNGFSSVGSEGSLKKRKDIETNGASHENNELRPNKMARPASNISPENGRKYFSQSPGPQSSLKIGSNGGQRVNGMTTSQPVSHPAKKPPNPVAHNVPSKPSPIKLPPVITNHVPAQSPLVTTTKPPPSIPNPITPQPKPPPAVVNKVTPPPLPTPKKKPKPPHPDTRYLNQILSVPKPDQWCGLDDQEWLLSSKAGPTSKKLSLDDLEVQVWSEAKHIESVDICALPYVIPY